MRPFPKKILYIEDVNMENSSIVEAIRSRGHEVSPFRTGEEAIRFIRFGNHPHLVITDLNLGEGITGFEFLELLKEEKYQGLKIILTGYSDARAMLKANNLKVNEYLIKSKNDIEDLLITIDSITEKDIFRFQKTPDIISDKEAECLNWLSRGFSYEDIAKFIYRSVSAVKFRCGKAFEKLGIRNRAELNELKIYLKA